MVRFNFLLQRNYILKLKVIASSEFFIMFFKNQMVPSNWIVPKVDQECSNVQQES